MLWQTSSQSTILLTAIKCARCPNDATMVTARTASPVLWLRLIHKCLKHLGNPIQWPSAEKSQGSRFRLMKVRFRRNYFECRQCALRRARSGPWKEKQGTSMGERIEEARGMRSPGANLGTRPISFEERGRYAVGLAAYTF